MNKLFIKLLAFVFSVTLIFNGVNQSYGQKDYNILVIGDDISTGDATRLSWRYYLWKNLLEDATFNYTIDMVGTQPGNFGGNPTWPDVTSVPQGVLESFDPDHEAHYAKLAYQLGIDLNTYLPNYSADIVLIHAGVVELNNYNQGFPAVYPPRLYNRLKGIIRLVQGANPGATVFVAQHIPFNQTTAEGDVATYNSLIANINDDLDQNVFVVDMNTGFETDSIVVGIDTILNPNPSYYIEPYGGPNWYRPNDAGEQEIGSRFHTAIMANLPAVKNRWNGSVSTAWSTPANWSKGAVPLSTDDVVIASGATNWPVVSGNLTIGVDCRDFVMEPNTQCTVNGDVLIQSEKTFIVYPSADLTISGDLKNSESILGGGKVNITPGIEYMDVNAYMTFTCTSAFELVSVKVYPNNGTLPGSRTFYWSAYNSGTGLYEEQQEITVPIPEDLGGDGERIDLNFNIATVPADPVNFPHRIGLKNSVSDDAKLGMDFENNLYPAAIGSIGEITGADPTFDPLGQWRYWYMYDWEFIPLDGSAYISHTLYGENSALNFNGAANNSMIGSPKTDGSAKLDKDPVLGGYNDIGAINIFPMRFNCMFPFRLVSAVVYAESGKTGPKSIVWLSADGTLGDTVVVDITAEAATAAGQRIVLDFLIPPGTGHKLGVLSGEPMLWRDFDGVGLGANGTGFSYPFPLGNVGNITATNIFMFYYQYFYDIEVAPVYYDVNIMKPGNSMATNGDIGVGNNLTVEPGSFFTIDTDDDVYVGNELQLQSDATGVSSFMNNGTLHVDTTRVEQYLTPNRWHYVSSPITDGKSGVYTGMYMKNWDEPTYAWNYISAINYPMTPMRGFSAWATSAYTATYKGDLNDGPHNLIVSSQYAGGDGDPGYNLAGNPFASSLDWDAASGWTKTDVDNTIYFWSGNDDIAGSGTYLAYQGAGGELPGVGIGTASSIIPPGQGFFVHATAASGTLSVDNQARVHNSQAFYKNGQDNALPLIRLQAVDQSNQNDETVIRFYENSTVQHDGEYDAYKLNGYNYPQLYSLTNEGSRLAINTLPKFEEGTVIPLGFTAPEDGQYSIKLTEFSNFDETTGLYLEDLLTGELYAISDNPTYSFVASAEDDPNRFLLIFKGIASDIEDLEIAEVRIFSFQKNVIVTIPETTESATIRIFDLMGKEMHSEKISGELKATIPVNGRKGYYVVKVQTDVEMYTEKVFIQ